MIAALVAGAVVYVAALAVACGGAPWLRPRGPG